jgi:thioredoxin-dependent peroxiredoxin
VQGDRAPDFELKDQDGKSVRLSDFKGRWVILYFYPKDDTPGCTKEACSFRDNMQTFEGTNVAVLGVSLDSPESHQKFIKKFNLSFPLLCDEDAKVSRAYGVYKKKNMYARLFWGIERSTFVIGPDGKIEKVFRKVKVDGHVGEVLEVMKGP